METRYEKVGETKRTIIEIDKKLLTNTIINIEVVSFLTILFIIFGETDGTMNLFELILYSSMCLLSLNFILRIIKKIMLSFKKNNLTK